MTDFIKKIKEFNKRWNISNNDSYDEEFNKFRIRIFNILDDIDDHVTEDGVKQFCQLLGIPEDWYHDDFSGPQGTHIIDALKAEKNEKEFYRLLQMILLC